MRSSILGFVALAAATAIFSGCDSRSAVLTDPPARVIADAACQFNIMNDLIRNYFAASDQGPAKTLVAQMKAFFVAGNLVKATDKGFDVLALVEAATTAHRQVGTPQAGSALSNALLACMSVGSPQLPIDFSGPLGPGGFGVRGGPTDPATTPVLSRDGLSGVGLQETTWLAVFGKRVLLYGTPNPAATFNELLIGNPYTWSTLPPSPIINPGAIIGFCITNPGRYRVEESHTATPHSILFLRDANFLTCPAPSPIIPNALGPVGGSAKGFSDFGPVDAISINLSYPSQPSTVQAGQIMTPAVRIQALGNGGTPLPEVGMVISLVQVSGTGSLTGTLSKVTGPSGIETFDDLRVSAPGTYTLLVTASLAGYGTVQLQSAQFTVIP